MKPVRRTSGSPLYGQSGLFTTRGVRNSCFVPVGRTREGRERTGEDPQRSGRDGRDRSKGTGVPTWTVQTTLCGSLTRERTFVLVQGEGDPTGYRRSDECRRRKGVYTNGFRTMENDVPVKSDRGRQGFRGFRQVPASKTPPPL